MSWRNHETIMVSSTYWACWSYRPRMPCRTKWLGTWNSRVPLGWLTVSVSIQVPRLISERKSCYTVYPKKYAHGFVVLCFVVVMQSFIMNSHEVFIQIHQGCFVGTGAIVRLPQCQWSKPDGYGKISQFITTTKHSKAKTVCIFLGIYCSNHRQTSNISRNKWQNLNLSSLVLQLSLPKIETEPPFWWPYWATFSSGRQITMSN